MTTSPLRAITFSITHLLLLPSLLSPIFLPHVDAYRQRAPDIHRGVKWLQEETQVLVRLDTPDLPLWNPHNLQRRIGEKSPTAFIFNFTLQDRKVLLLNNVPILPLRDASVPSVYQAPQTSITLSQFEYGTLPDFTESPAFELDYYRAVHPGEHPDSRYNVYDPVLEFDVLGVSTHGFNTLLANDKQRIIRVSLAELEPYQKYPYDKPISQRAYKITDVVLQDRFPYNTFVKPEEMQQCALWFWRCADMNEYPWYKYIYREAFDEFGKIGSLRHALLQRFDMLSQKLGVRQASFLVVVMIFALFALPVYGTIGIFRRMKTHFEPYGEQNERYEMLLQVADEDEFQDENMESVLVATQAQRPESVAIETEGRKPLPHLPIES